MTESLNILFQYPDPSFVFAVVGGEILITGMAYVQMRM